VQEIEHMEFRFAHLIREQRRLYWDMCNLAVRGEAVFGDDWYQAVPKGQEYRMRKALWLGKNFPPKLQDSRLSISCYEAMVKLDDDAKQRLIKKAAENGWGRDQMREAVKAYKESLDG